MTENFQHGACSKTSAHAWLLENDPEYRAKLHQLKELEQKKREKNAQAIKKLEEMLAKKQIEESYAIELRNEIIEGKEIFDENMAIFKEIVEKAEKYEREFAQALEDFKTTLANPLTRSAFIKQLDYLIQQLYAKRDIIIYGSIKNNVPIFYVAKGENLHQIKMQLREQI